MPFSTRDSIISVRSEKMESEAIKNTHYQAKVTDFYGGNQYYLMVYEQFSDIRLVGAPPRSIGDFGGDTDNWMWPRHAGDFSIFRIYTSPDGNPAPHSTENIPYKPKRYLSISMHGVEKNDFTMVIGYPGSTQRYSTSYEIKEILNYDNPIRIQVRDRRQQIMNEDMHRSNAIKLKYVEKYNASSNYWKYCIGQNKDLIKNNVLENKQHKEAEFQSWVNQSSKLKSTYGNVLSDIKSAVESVKISSGRYLL